MSGAFETGTATCESCGYDATALYDGEMLKVVCDHCGFEFWGRVTKEHPPGSAGPVLQLTVDQCALERPEGETGKIHRTRDEARREARGEDADRNG